MSSANIVDTKCADEELYELCERNGFIDARPVVTGRPRRNSAPDILMSASDSSASMSFETFEVAKQPCSMPEDAVTTCITAGESRQEPAERSPCVTTFMLKNVPCKLNVEMMKPVLDRLGFAGTYNHLYFPARKNGSNLGYGFVNFMKEDDACRFKAVFNGYVFQGMNSRKQCCVIPADVQGRDANLRMHSRSSAYR
eukprot:TRINITY_DN16353_c1_g1_i1.p1 TRINITY_DN16353_c1_g1~~TRINITY_DN16353_c1_g1_i1.p1  ORF type:complete len:218 (+),score=35.88 TRINITY_DN16353_c1_g1_i1:64-654(+)